MNKIRKKLIALFTMFIMCISMITYDAKADAAVYVSVSSGSTTVGGSVNASVSISGDFIAGTVYVSYDSSVLRFNSVSGAIANDVGGSVMISVTAAATATISFTAVSEGTCGIYTSGEFFDIEGNPVNTNYGSASVTVAKATAPPPDAPTEAPSTETDNRSGNNYLYTLSVGSGTLEPAFDASIQDYTLRLPETATSVEITAYPADNKSKVSVYGGSELTVGANTAEVVVTAENGYTRTYSIRIIVGEVLEDQTFTIDGVSYTLVVDEDEIAEAEEFPIPEGFSPSSAKYQKWDILVYKSEGGNVLLACMKDEEGNYGWFVYDSEKQIFSKYVEYSLAGNRYILLNIPDGTTLPKDYTKTEITVNEVTVSAFESELLGEGYYIVYAANILKDSGFYILDMTEGNLLRIDIATLKGAPEETTEEIIPPTTEETTEEAERPVTKYFTRGQLYIGAIIAGVILLAVIIVIIFLSTKISVLKQDNEDIAADSDKQDDEVAVTNEEAINEEASKEEESSKEDTAKEDDKSVVEDISKTEELAETTDDVTEIEAEALEASQEVTEDIAEVSEATEKVKSEENLPEAKPVKKKSSFEISDAEEDISSQIEKEGEKFENLAKEINEKIESDYDANEDSAFS